MSVPDRHVVRWSDLSYASMDSCHVNWRAMSGEANDVSAAVKCPSVDVLEMDDVAVLLEKYADRAQGIGSVDPRSFGN